MVRRKDREKEKREEAIREEEIGELQIGELEIRVESLTVNMHPPGGVSSWTISGYWAGEC